MASTEPILWLPPSGWTPIKSMAYAIPGNGPSFGGIDFLGIQDLLQNAIQGHQGDAQGTQQAIYAGVLTLLGLASAASFIPTEANAGGPIAGHIVDRLVKPLTEGAINGPIKYYLDAIFHFKHVRASVFTAGISEGVFSNAQITEWLTFSGLSANDMSMILTLAAAKRFDRLTKDEYALLELYQRDLRTAQIDIQKVDNDQLVADAKVELAGAKAALKAGDAEYSYTVRP